MLTGFVLEALERSYKNLTGELRLRKQKEIEGIDRYALWPVRVAVEDQRPLSMDAFTSKFKHFV
jgi:hypothetical protein